MMRGVSQMLRPILLTSLLFVAGSAAAQFAPSRPVRLIIASAPGGGTDAIGRMLAESLAPLVTQTMFSGPAVPHTMLSAVVVPQTMLSAVPQTMFAPVWSAVPHTMFWQFSSPHSVPHTMLSALPAVPQTMFASWVIAVPHTMLVAHALPRGLIYPPSTIWLPQMKWRLQLSCTGSRAPARLRA